MSHWSQALKRHGACETAVKWAATQATREAAWRNCADPSWMFFILGRLEVDRRQVVLAACACARLTLKYAKAGEERPRIAIETAEAWCRGEATIEQVRTARIAAAAAADAAYYAAAADAAAAAAADDAAYYAAAADAAADAARKQMRIDCCNEIRRVVPMPELTLRKRAKRAA